MNQPKFHQLWSVWGLTILAIITAIEPVFPALQAALPPAWQAPAAAVILVLRAIKQNPPRPPSNGAAVGLAMLLVGCGAQPPAPKYTPEELLCIADAEAVKIKAFGACKPCSDAQVDAIMDHRKTAGQACYLGAK